MSRDACHGSSSLPRHPRHAGSRRRFAFASLRAALTFAVSATAAVNVANAQDIEPRSYSNAPVGVNFLIAGYGYTQGGVPTDSLPVTNPHLDTSNMIFAYARSLDLWGKSAKFDVIVPYTWLSGSATDAGRPVERVVNGFSNPSFRLSINLCGAPALTLKEFSGYQQDLIVGASLQVSAPWGQYDGSRLINIGTNRWFFKPEMGISKAFGAWTFEGAAAVTLYHGQCGFLRRQQPYAGPALFGPGPHHLQLPQRRLGFGRRNLVRRRAHDDQRRAKQRSAAELARRQHAGVSDRPIQLHQIGSQQWRLGAHRQQLRSSRTRVAAPLGRRILRVVRRE